MICLRGVPFHSHHSTQTIVPFISMASETEASVQHSSTVNTETQCLCMSMCVRARSRFTIVVRLVRLVDSSQSYIDIQHINSLTTRDCLGLLFWWYASNVYGFSLLFSASVCISIHCIHFDSPSIQHTAHTYSSVAAHSPRKHIFDWNQCCVYGSVWWYGRVRVRAWTCDWLRVCAVLYTPYTKRCRRHIPRTIPYIFSLLPTYELRPRRNSTATAVGLLGTLGLLALSCQILNIVWDDTEENPPKTKIINAMPRSSDQWCTEKTTKLCATTQRPQKKFDSKNYSPKIFFTHIDFLIEMQNNEILFDF